MNEPGENQDAADIILILEDINRAMPSLELSDKTNLEVEGYTTTI
jgi:hypothetical protein